MRKPREITSLIGQNFNKLTVLSQDGKNKDNLIVWLCKCDCGNLHKVTGSHLKRGRVKSCGCYRADMEKEKFEKNKANFIGKIFGKLKVVEFLRVEGRKRMWKCLCECGNTKITSYDCLSQNYIKSCGCASPCAFIDKTGLRYGQLIVIKLNQEILDKKGGYYWKCLCDCGKTSLVETGSLRNNNKSTKSCGCLKDAYDLCGQKFGRLTALNVAGKTKGKQNIWSCRCDCGNFSKCLTSALTDKRIKSCGCLRNEKVAERMTGEKNPNWRFDLTPEQRIESKNRQHNPDLLIWKKKVFKRDNYRCQITGAKSSKNDTLCAHHLYSYVDNKELRCDENNGIVILQSLHLMFHKLYGFGYNNPEQFREFKSRYDAGEWLDYQI